VSDLGPAAFSAETGLSAKALRLYEERGLLVPAIVDPSTGYRRYRHEQVDTASRIALLRQAGIGLADIGRFLAAPTAAAIEGWLTDLNAETEARRRALAALAGALGLVTSPVKENAVTVIIRAADSLAELTEAFDVAGAQCDPVIDHTDERRFSALRDAYPDQRSLLLVAEVEGAVAGAAMGFLTPLSGATLRILAVESRYRQQGVGRALLRQFEAGAARLGVRRISLGADDEAGFYVRHGYQMMLLLQWVYEPHRYEADIKALVNGPARGMQSRRSSFSGVPQLFIDLDEPNPTVTAQVRDAAAGAHVGYCMTRVIHRIEVSAAEEAPA
jgi:DNA-binding transcriptional MerR regulator/ribosomal protein S18 acetylase RimI-like enzyme